MKISILLLATLAGCIQDDTDSNFHDILTTLCSAPAGLFQQYQDCLFEDAPAHFSSEINEVLKCIEVGTFQGLVDKICADVNAGEDPDMYELYVQWTECQSEVGHYMMNETEQTQTRNALLKCYPIMEGYVPDGFMKPEF